MSEGDDSTWPQPPEEPGQPSGGVPPTLVTAPLAFRGRKPPALDPIPDWLTRSMGATVPALGPAVVLSGAGVVAWLTVTWLIAAAFPLLGAVVPNASEPVRFVLRVIPAVTGAVFFTAAAHAVFASHLGYRSSAGRSLRRVAGRLGPVLTVLVPLVAIRIVIELWVVRLLFRGPSPVRIIVIVGVALVAARLVLALVSAVVGPADRSAYGQSWRLTSGGYMPMLGRTIVLAGIVVVGSAVARAVIISILTMPTMFDPSFDRYLAFTIEAVIGSFVLILVNSAIADLYLQTGGDGHL